MPVSTPHEDYTKNVKQWELVTDCVEGSAAIKDRSGGQEGDLNNLKGTRYLPMPNIEDQSIHNIRAYHAYKQRAIFVNFTGHTREGLIGMAFRSEPEVTIPASIEYMKGNMNGDRLSFNQFSSSILGGTLNAGRVGLLVDYPDADQGMTQAEVNSLGLRAVIKKYDAVDIINWRTKTVGSVTKLDMVVLRERHDDCDGDFDNKSEIYHRVLMMMDGVYVQILFDENDEQVIFDNGATEIIPHKNDGTTWAEIPFVFVGANENDVNVDKAPLYDIAAINVGHYQNSADYEESCFFVGQATPYIAGLTQSWIDANFKDGILLGSRSFLPLPEGGAAGLLQASPNIMPREGMRDKEQQMVMIGARIIQDNSGIETAEAAKIRFAGQNSKLGVLANNVAEALEDCFMYALEFMGGGGQIETDVEIEFNKQFYDATVDPQLLMAQIQLLDRGIFAKSDMRNNLRKTNLIEADRTDEDLDGEAETMNPML